jgi:hypothetical protein
MRLLWSACFARAYARLAVGLVLAASAILPVAAATYIVPSDDVLVRKAAAVVRGRVAAVTPVELPEGGIETHVTIEIARVLKGQVGAPQVVVRQPGGDLGGRADVYPGIGGFAVDEQVLVMLDSPSPDLFQVTDFALGNFTVLTASDGTEILRRQGLKDAFILSPTSDALGTAPPASVQASEPGVNSALPLRGGAPSPTGEPDRDAAAFERYIVAIGSGLNPRVDYVLPAPKATTDRFAAFTFLGTPPARWIQFDSQTPVVYKDNSNGDSGSLCVDGCHAQVAAAPAIWSAATGTQIYLQYGGVDATVGSKCLSALVNQINFGDPCNQLTNLTSCAGTLALGGFSSMSTSGGHPSCPAKGNPNFERISNAKVMINNGTGSCLSACDYTSMITHETGHTIGAGHSGDPTALMAPFLIHGVCGALQADDLAFAQCVYPLTVLTCNLSASKTWTGPAPMAVTFNPGVAGGVQPLVYDYSMGDGSAESVAAPVHTFASAGTYTIHLNITDAQDQNCDSSVTVTVQPCLPSTVSTATGSVVTTGIKAVVVGAGFKGGSVVQIDAGGGWVAAPVTKRKTGKKLVAKNITAEMWPAGTPVQLRVVSSTGCPSNPVQAIR